MTDVIYKYTNEQIREQKCYKNCLKLPCRGKPRMDTKQETKKKKVHKIKEKLLWQRKKGISDHSYQ